MSQASTPDASARAEVFACDGPVEVDVNMRNGLLDVRATDAPGVRVQLSIMRGDAPRWEQGSEGTEQVSAGESHPSDAEAHALRESEISFSDTRRRLQIRTPRGFRRFGIGISVEVPEGSQLAARLHRGSVSAAGPLSSLRAATGTGSIRAERVNGDIEVATGSGDLWLGQASGRLRARSGSGRIEVESLEGDGARVTTGRGDVQLGAVDASVRARTGHGRVAVSDAAGGRLDLVTGAGDVTVAVRPGIGAEIDLASGWGEARSELAVTDRAPARAPAVRIRARTGSGDAIVARAGG
jgi:Putative adhesin